MKKILHIVVNYKNDRDTRGLIAEASGFENSDHVQFAVVNNSACSLTENSLGDLSNEQTFVLSCPDNPGYFGAAHRVLDFFSPKDFDFVLLSNSDLKIINSDFYTQLLSLAKLTNVGAIAPSISSELTGCETNPLYWDRPSKGKIHFLKWIYSNFFFAFAYHFLSFLKFLLARVLFPQAQPTSQQFGRPIYAPHGSFLILTRNYFTTGGSFKYPAKLYGEEIFLAENLLQAGLEAILAPHLKIVHREKGSEASGWARWTISRTTFEFKRESSAFLASLF